MIKELVRKNSDRSLVTIKGKRGYFTTTFKPHQKVYIFNVSKFNKKGLEKIEWKFDKKTNKLECWTNDKFFFGSMQFAVHWKASNHYKRVNI